MSTCCKNCKSENAEATNCTKKQNSELHSRPDYEAEYRRLMRENHALRSEIVVLRNTLLGMCKSLYGRENN